jgi:type III pantothenate kinase
MHTICFDFGNTRLKAALYNKEGELKEVIELSNSVTAVQSLIDLYKPCRTILASVMNHQEEILQVLSEQTKFQNVTIDSSLNFTIEVGKKNTIGVDRLALVAAAVKYFPNKNNLVISLGSCITYNFVNQYHQFLGGAISPGMEMRFKSMHDYTSKLPLVEKDWNLPLIGYDTKTNLQKILKNHL